jgi:hypothetical protein
MFTKNIKKIKIWLDGNGEIKILLKDFASYFEKIFLADLEVQETLTNTRYSHSFWSVSNNILKLITRTTCSVEAWHRGLNQSIN